MVLDSYTQGLLDAGWQGDPAQIRYAFAAGSALRYGLGTVRLVLPQLLDVRTHWRLEELLGRPVGQVLEDWRVFYRYLLDQADYARAMQRAIGIIKPSTVSEMLWLSPLIASISASLQEAMSARSDGER